MPLSFGRISWILILVFSVVIGVTFLVFSTLPFEPVKAKIDTFAPDGRADPFTAELFRHILLKLRVLGIILFLTGILFYVLRQRIERFLSEFSFLCFTSCFPFLRHLTRSLREGIAKEEKMHLFVLLGFVFLAIGMRVHFLFRPMRYDEAVTFVYYASRPFYMILANYYASNNHIFHTLLVHMTYLLFGNHPWVLRLPALVSGVLLVPASYLWTRIFFNKESALLTAGVVAASSGLIEYSVNARGYTLLCLIFLLALSLAVYLKHHRNFFGWLLFSVLLAAGFWTMTTMLFPFGIIVLWLGISVFLKDTDFDRSLFRKDLLLFSFLALFWGGLVYIPAFLTVGLNAIVGDLYGSIPWSNLLAERLSLFRSMWDLWNRDVPRLVSLLFVIGFFASLLFHKRIARHRIPLILPVLLWCFPILIVKRAILPGRAFLFLFPIYIGMASAGLLFLFKAILPKITRPLSLIAGILAISLSCALSLNVARSQLLYESEQTGLRDVAPITLFLKEYLRKRDKVLAKVPSDVPLIYYFDREGIPMGYLYSDAASSDRLIVIVNEGVGQTLPQLLEEVQAGKGTFTKPRLIRQYPFAALYEMDRR